MDQTQSVTNNSSPDTKAPLPQSSQNSILARPIILGDLTLASPTTVTTIGSNGAATALTANPLGYVIIMVGNTSVQIPYYSLA